MCTLNIYHNTNKDKKNSMGTSLQNIIIEKKIVVVNLTDQKILTKYRAETDIVD